MWFNVHLCYRNRPVQEMVDRLFCVFVCWCAYLYMCMCACVRPFLECSCWFIIKWGSVCKFLHHDRTFLATFLDSSLSTSSSTMKKVRSGVTRPWLLVLLIFFTIYSSLSTFYSCHADKAPATRQCYSVHCSALRCSDARWLKVLVRCMTLRITVKERGARTYVWAILHGIQYPLTHRMRDDSSILFYHQLQPQMRRSITNLKELRNTLHEIFSFNICYHNGRSMEKKKKSSKKVYWFNFENFQ